MLAKSLRTVSQLVEELPAFDEPAIRRLIFHAEEKGLAHAVVRVGRRVYIDIDAFNRWLEEQRASNHASLSSVKLHAGRFART